MKFNIGDKANVEKHFSSEEIKQFSELSLDKNPLHFDGEFSRNAMFGKPIVHGMLVAGLISAAIGSKVPGPGSIYLSQSLKFVAPVFIGDNITAEVEILSINKAKGIVKLSTLCKNQDGKEVLLGEALIMHPDLKGQ